MLAYDMKAPSGCGFVWCEYRDDYGLCLNGSCLDQVPKGLACGFSDSYLDHGRCLGQPTRSNGCPSGFAQRGWFDAGRPSGHGVGWCEKL
jgi:hypothetical protein